MDVIGLANEIWRMRSMNWLELSLEDKKIVNEKFENVLGELLNNIEKNNWDVMDLIIIKEKDQELFSMPIEIMFKVHQKIINSEFEVKKNLRDFAIYLSFYGPDWEEESNAIISNLNEGNIDEAIKISSKVDYNKYI